MKWPFCCLTFVSLSKNIEVMTREEKISALKNMSSFVAYPTAMTYDMGMEYEVISKNGFMGSRCRFERWPAFIIDIFPEIRSLIEKRRLGKELLVEDFNETPLKGFISEDEMDCIKKLFDVISLDSKIYMLELPWGTNAFYLSKEELLDAFFDKYGGVETEWDEMEDESIDYIYNQAVDNNWSCVMAVCSMNRDDEDENYGEEDESIVDSENATHEELYQKAIGAAKLGQLEYSNMILEEAIAAGSAAAMNQLACNLLDGYGVPVDSKRAFKLWMDAAELGNAMAQYNVAIGYVRGVYSERPDYNNSFDWCMKSAQQGYPESIATIGQMYFYGHGVEQNYDKAFKWLTNGVIAGAGGFFCFLLGYCYENGYGVNTDTSKARELYEAAGDNEYAIKGLNRLNK